MGDPGSWRGTSGAHVLVPEEVGMVGDGDSYQRLP